MNILLLPFVLGTLLGPIMVTNLRIVRKLGKGNRTVLISGPIFITIWVLPIRWLCSPVFIGPMLRKTINRKIDTDSADQIAKHNQDTDSEAILRNLD